MYLRMYVCTYQYFTPVYGFVPTASTGLPVLEVPYSTQLLLYRFGLVLILLLCNPAQLYRASPPSSISASYRMFGGTAPWQLSGRVETRYLKELLFAAPGL